MARQEGLLGIRGTVGGLTFKSDGTVSQAPRKRAITATRTLEANAEFGNAATAGKYFRNGLQTLSRCGSGRYTVSRVTQKMREAINLDSVSVRGQRNVLDGEVSVLQGFEFNDAKPVSGLFSESLDATITRASGACAVVIPAYIPLNSVAAPTGATHYKIIAEASAINFETGVSQSGKAETMYHALNATPLASETLSVALPAGLTDPIFLGVTLEFYQQLNEDYYVLENAAYNAATILKVDTGA